MANGRLAGTYWWQVLMPMKVNAQNLSHHKKICFGVYVKYLFLNTLIFEQRELGVSEIILAFNYMKVTE
ncbi:hypothetical protein V6Z11_D05G212200 [Gossypium hirsutum]